MDPLSISASAAGLLSLLIQLSGGLITYYETYKDQDEDVAVMLGSSRGLSTTLTQLQKALTSRSLDREMVKNITGSIESCRAVVEKLQRKMEKINHSPKPFIAWQIFQEKIRRGFYPLKASTLAKLREIIGDLRENLSLALETLQIDTSATSLDHLRGIVQGINVLQTQFQKVQDFRSATETKFVAEWLAAPDTVSDHLMAAKQRTRGTAQWLLKEDKFKKWKSQPDSIFWLSGRPGTGKTIQCTAIIEDLIIQKTEDSLLAFFYFKFDQPGKNSVPALLKSLLQQLAAQWLPAVDVLKLSYSAHGNGLLPPQTDALLSILNKIADSAQFTFLVLDALDECVERDELQDLFYKLSEWRLGKLNVLVTSRPEQSLEDALAPIAKFSLDISGAPVDDDILLFIRDRLQHDAAIQHWPQPLKNLTETVLVRGAGGMFRWVACQIMALHQCFSPYMVEQALNSLPKTLDKTYEHILLSIQLDPTWIHEVLMWVVFSARPLFVDELSEVLTIEVMQDRAVIDKSKRLFDDSIIAGIFSSLVRVQNTWNPWTIRSNASSKELHLAHASVKDYLISDRIRGGNAAQFALEPFAAHDMIARACLGYLAQFDTSVSLELVSNYPLVEYAAEFWTYHARKISTEKTSSKVIEVATEFLLDGNNFRNWIRLFDPDERKTRNGSQAGLGRILPSVVPSPLYYASIAGLQHIVRSLLDRGLNADAQGGNLGSPLQAACHLGYHEVVSVLVEHNANEEIDGPNGPAMVSAAESGYSKVVELLLRRGYATTNKRIIYIAAVHAAARNGQIPVCKVLLGQNELSRVQVSLLDDFPSLLEELAENGDLDIIQLLFGSVLSSILPDEEPVTDPIAANRTNITSRALEAAARNTKSTEVLLRFLSLGITPTDKVLEAAAWNKEHGAEAVKLVLEHGVFMSVSEDILAAAASNNSQGRDIMRELLSRFPHALRTTKVLKAAARRGGFEILKMLLDPIILDVTISPEVMFEAATRGDADIMEFLLDYNSGFPITEEFLAAVMENMLAASKILERIVMQYGEIHLTEKLKLEMARHMDTWMLAMRVKDDCITADQFPQ